MSLTAHHFLEVAVDVARRGQERLIEFAPTCIDSEEHSLESIRKWDRNSQNTLSNFHFACAIHYCPTIRPCRNC